MQDTMPGDVDFVTGGKLCKCGSSTHQSTFPRDCPLTSAKKAHNSMQDNTPIVVEPGIGKCCVALQVISALCTMTVQQESCRLIRHHVKLYHFHIDSLITMISMITNNAISF